MLPPTHSQLRATGYSTLWLLWSRLLRSTQSNTRHILSLLSCEYPTQNRGCAQLTLFQIATHSSSPLSTSSTPKLPIGPWRRWTQSSTRHPASSMSFRSPAMSPTATARRVSFSSITRRQRSTCVALAMFQRRRSRWLMRWVIWRLERVPMLSTARIARLTVVKPLDKADSYCILAKYFAMSINDLRFGVHLEY